MKLKTILFILPSLVLLACDGGGGSSCSNSDILTGTTWSKPLNPSGDRSLYVFSSCGDAKFHTQYYDANNDIYGEYTGSPTGGSYSVDGGHCQLSINGANHSFDFTVNGNTMTVTNHASSSDFNGTWDLE